MTDAPRTRSLFGSRVTLSKDRSMRQSKNQSRLARVLRRLVRCEGGGGDLLTGIIMTGAGLLAVSQTLPPLRDAFNTAGDALKRQAGVLARGSDTGSVNGLPSSGGIPSGGSGFDFGSTPGNPISSGGSSGATSSKQIASGSDPGLVTP